MPSTPVPASMAWLFPFMSWLPNMTRSSLRSDFIAAITGAVIMLPQGVAFATIAGMPPQYGLYAGMIPAIIAALYGSSRHLVSGPTTAASIVVFSALSQYAEPFTMDYVELALTLTAMVGILQVIFGLARLGTLVNFISHSVVIGFTAGAAILIGAKQINSFFGTQVDTGEHLPRILMQFFGDLSAINPYVTSVAMATLLSGILIKRFLPIFPYMIAALLVGTMLGLVLNTWVGQDITGIATVGALPAALPPLTIPKLHLGQVQDLALSALAVTLFALTEAASIGRSLAARGGYRIDGNQEFIGQGLSNIAGSFFSGYVATGSFNRSGLNYQSGAKTPMAAVFGGVLLMFLVLFVGPLAAYLPKAAMAGILFLVAWGLVDRIAISHIVKSSKRDTSVFLTTFFGALFLDLEFAILGGVLLSLIMYLERASKPKIVTRTIDPRLLTRPFSNADGLAECPQMHLVRIDGPLFFGSAAHVEEAFDEIRTKYPSQKQLIVICLGIGFADLQGVDVLVSEARRRRAQGGDLYLAKVNDDLWDTLDQYGYTDEIGSNNIFQSKKAVIHAVYQKVDKKLCEDCDKRIFWECTGGQQTTTEVSFFAPVKPLNT